MKVTIVIPTYNEANNLPLLVDELLAQPLSQMNIFVVDDASPDGTGEVADRLAARTPDQLTVIHRTGARGLGLAYLDGFRRALDSGADAVVQMDADFSHAPTCVPKLVERIDEYDVVVGSRYVPEGLVDKEWSWGRYVLSWWANVYARSILGIKTHDATAGFKCWRASALRAIDLERVRSNGYVFQVEMAFISERLGLRILELPIYFEDRRIGKSKMTMPVKFEAAWRVWQVRWRHRHLRPLERPLEQFSDAPQG
jgi:dolichol-phosphate mannosyltransferase